MKSTIRKVRVLANPRWLKPVLDLSDRAKRYRSNHPSVRPPDPQQCGYCASLRNVGVDHVDGYEENLRPQNLLWACKSCNALKSSVLKNAGKGRRVQQRNPPGGVPTMKEYGDAIKVMRGVFQGDVGAAVSTIQRAPASLRSSYTKQAWRQRKLMYGPSGRASGGAVPF